MIDLLLNVVHLYLDICAIYKPTIINYRYDTGNQNEFIFAYVDTQSKHLYGVISTLISLLRHRYL